MQLGTRLSGHSQTYIIERTLGTGAVSEVYGATVEGSTERVAINILRDDADAEVAKHFFLEAEVLRQLYDAETQLDAQHAILRIYEIQREGTPHFFVQALARGSSLEALLNQESAVFDEAAALTITAQIARLLELWHTKLRRSTDLQLKHIFWDAATRSVAIIGCSNVSALEVVNAEKDLFWLGCYLYQMLIGQQVDRIHGATESELMAQTGARWQAISFGGRQLVLQALHPDPQQRFLTAHSFRTAVDWLIAQWDKAGIVLATEIGGFLTVDTEQALLQANILLNLARRHGGVPPQTLNELARRIAASSQGKVIAYGSVTRMLSPAETEIAAPSIDTTLLHTMPLVWESETPANTSMPMINPNNTSGSPLARWLPFVLGLVALVAIGSIGFFLGRSTTPPLNNSTQTIVPATQTSGVPIQPSPTTQNTAQATPLPTITATATASPPPSATATSVPTAVATKSSAAITISIDQNAFQPPPLFDLPLKINGNALPGTEVQITINNATGTILTISVATNTDGTWIWRPTPDEPALSTGDYTIFASIVISTSREVVLSTPISFQIQAPPQIIVQAACRMYTQPNINVAYLSQLASGDTLEVVGWTNTWYHVRTRTNRRLGWIETTCTAQPLTEAEKQSIPKQ